MCGVINVGVCVCVLVYDITQKQFLIRSQLVTMMAMSYGYDLVEISVEI
jgi:hypothetical protein